MKTASRADWGVDAYPPAEKNRRSWTVAAVAVVVVVVLVTLVALPLGIVPALVLGAVTLAAALWWIMQQGSLALRSTRARPVDETRFPRFVNVASGLARDLGIEMPRLFVIEKGEPNALVTRSRTPVIAMTTALLEGFTRTELEAVVAHCLE
ncbi:MAG TPA: hypothetical protein VFK89_07840, partial [Actinomycetota bacterium]|nr:hypothetical protein [Actinomycetota bacterium]